MNIQSENSPLNFETTGDSSWKIWDRFISVNGENIYHIGNICGTCIFFFEKLKDKDKIINPRIEIDKLNNGLTSIDSSVIENLKRIIPSGNYELNLRTINPRYVYKGKNDDYFVHEQVKLWGVGWGNDGDLFLPMTDYYRGKNEIFGQDKEYFDFYIPLTSLDLLDSKRVNFYKNEILSGKKPTAVSLSVLDIKEPSTYPDEDTFPEITQHWCIANYLIDGHHKIKAAAELNTEITLLAFFATDKGVSTEDEIKELLKRLE